MRSAPSTLAQFRSHAVAGFKRANPEAGRITVTWERSRRFPMRDGSGIGFSGVFLVSANGYDRRRMYASFIPGATAYDGGQLIVR